MISRTSHVKRIIFKNIVFSSNFLIGDSRYIDTIANVLAVKYDADCYSTEEFTVYEQDANFDYKAPCPTISETIRPSFFNRNPKICVNNVNMIAISASSIFQVGSSEHVRLTSSVYFMDETKKKNHTKKEE